MQYEIFSSRVHALTRGSCIIETKWKLFHYFLVHFRSEYSFSFDDNFEIHDDVEVLKRMGLLLGLLPFASHSMNAQYMQFILQVSTRENVLTSIVLNRWFRRHFKNMLNVSAISGQSE